MIFSIQCGPHSPDLQSKVEDLLAAEKNIKGWIRYLDSAWLIDTDVANPEGFRELLRNAPELQSPRVMITKFSSVYTGWLNKNVWNWLEGKKFDEEPKYSHLPPAPANANTPAVKKENGGNDKDMPAVEEITQAQSLDDYIGMDEIKHQANLLLAGIRFRAAARKIGMKLDSGFDNILLKGSPGVGKTSLAKSVAMMLKNQSPAPEKTPVAFVKAANVVARYLGQSGDNMQKLLDKYKDGIIVFDEIDTLLMHGVQSGADAYGRQVLDTINTHITSSPNKPVIVATLYESRENALQKANEGLASRFPNTLLLSDYDDTTLKKIFEKKAETAGLTLESGVTDEVQKLVTELRKVKKDVFANGREIDNIFSAIVNTLAEKVSESGTDITTRSAACQTDEDRAQLRKEIGLVTVADVPMRDPKTGGLTRKPTSQDRVDKRGKLLPFPTPGI